MSKRFYQVGQFLQLIEFRKIFITQPDYHFMNKVTCIKLSSSAKKTKHLSLLHCLFKKNRNKVTLPNKGKKDFKKFRLVIDIFLICNNLQIVINTNCNRVLHVSSAWTVNQWSVQRFPLLLSHNGSTLKIRTTL